MHRNERIEGSVICSHGNTRSKLGPKVLYKHCAYDSIISCKGVSWRRGIGTHIDGSWCDVSERSDNAIFKASQIVLKDKLICKVRK